MVQESPPRRPISVEVKEKVFVVLNPSAAQTVWTVTSEIVPKSMFTQVTEFNYVKSFKPSALWIPNVDHFGGLMI